METHRGWRRLASFARSTGDTREHAPTALTALPEEVRGGSDLRRRGAARVLSRVASVCGLTCNAHMPLYPRPSTFDVGLGGLDWGACSLWSMLYGEGRGPERRRAIDHRGVHGTDTVRVRVARRAPTRATPPDLDIVLSFLAAHPQSTPHKLIAVCWTGDRRRCSCGDELV